MFILWRGLRGDAGRPMLMRLQFKSKWAQGVHSVLSGNRAASGVSPTPGPRVAVAAWDEAFVRVESYLRAHHIESRTLLNALTNEILAAARALVPRYPGEAPVTLAIRVAQAKIGEWFMHAMGEGDWADERFRSRGRIALLMSEIPSRCPERFLSAEPLPAKLRAQLANARVYPTPELRVSSMQHSELEFSLGAAIDEKWSTFNRTTFLRASLSWVVILGAAGVVWIATRWPLHAPLRF
jgi:hypothetical protein